MTLIVLLSATLVAAASGAEREQLNVRVRVDLGDDLGQPYGTLWEAVDANGTPRAGAGFVSFYNTQDRSDRRLLHVYVRTTGDDVLTTELLPRPTTDAGTYLFGFDGRLYSKGRNAFDNQLRVWQPDKGQWNVDLNTIPFSVQIAGKDMAATSQQITYNGQIILELAADRGRIGEWFYSSGTLVVRRSHANATPAVNELIAFPWKPSDTTPLRIEDGITCALSTPQEFIYAFGEQGRVLVAASNMGGVHTVDGQRWRTIREPNGKSFQIYSTLNANNRLLLGQYPTGELFEFAGDRMARLPGWPPVMEGVRSSAREAQTLAIYGGDIYVGVWPWGEVWRLSGMDQSWKLMGRLFTHPEPTDQTTHPYELETRQLDPVLNRWGQRVTSMVPLGDSLYLSTSAKGPHPFEPKFSFLSGDKHLEYGAVHRFRKAGCLSLPIEWKSVPSTIDVKITATSIELLQDDKQLGTAEWDSQHPASLSGLSVRFGSGIFGPFGGAGVQEAEAQPKSIPRPFTGAYLHVNKLVPRGSTPAEQNDIIAQQAGRMKKFGLNAIMPFVTSSSGEAFYESGLLKRVYPNSDPVQTLLKEARRHGIGFYPVVPITICGDQSPQGVLSRHPEWALRHPDGRPMGYISPAHPEARRWLATVVGETIDRFQPDGIILDYIRYANRPMRFDAASEERFRKLLPADCTPEEERRLLQQFMESELTELVRSISHTARTAQPGLQIAAYVWGPHVAKDHQIAQVWPLWVERGYLDMVNVSGYCHRETYGDRFLDVFRERMADSLELNRKHSKPAMLTFALGINTSHGRVQSVDDIRSYLTIAEQLHMDGVAYFTWDYLQPYVGELTAERN